MYYFAMKYRLSSSKNQHSVSKESHGDLQKSAGNTPRRIGGAATSKDDSSALIHGVSSFVESGRLEEDAVWLNSMVADAAVALGIRINSQGRGWGRLVPLQQ